MGLESLSSNVTRAATPILLDEAISKFSINTPDLDTFLKKGSQYCSAFKTKFPEKVVVETKKG